MGSLVRFPDERRLARVESRTDAVSGPAVILILPVIRVERVPENPGSEPDAASAAGRKRRRRAPRS
jgi:hypothetical protein